jgi:NADH dehydrogenase
VEPERAGHLLTFVVVGGGLTGVEVAGALNDFVREAAEFYPEIERSRIRIFLIEAGPRLMPEMNEKLAAFAEKILERRGVNVRTNTSVVKVGDGDVQLSTGEQVPTDTLIWAAGVSPSPLIGTLGVPTERGRVKVNEYLEVEGIENVWALGDCALIPNPTTGKPHPPTAQHAVREGKRAGKNVAASLGIGVRRPFTYRTMGQLAIVGERTGIADIMGFLFEGFIAWFLWRTYYLNQIPQFEKRLRVMLDWTLDLFFKRDLVQLAVTRNRELSTTKHDSWR